LDATAGTLDLENPAASSIASVTAAESQATQSPQRV
jgi:hypothetical protein